MKTKIIPFDLETAKKIQAGKIEGRVLDRDNFEGTIITTNGVNTPMPVGIKFSFSKGDNILFFGIDGKNAKGNRLVLEVPDNESHFKPFDKVLVRCYDGDRWVAALYSHYNTYINTHVVCGGNRYQDCITYEGHENLVDTTDKPEEE